MNSEKGKYSVTKELTQNGIQNIIDVDLSHVSRVLKRNEELGLIERKKIRINNGSRKQYAFFLTDKGLGLVKTILNNFIGI